MELFPATANLVPVFGLNLLQIAVLLGQKRNKCLRPAVASSKSRKTAKKRRSGDLTSLCQDREPVERLVEPFQISYFP
jgi:hypothetical protein